MQKTPMISVKDAASLLGLDERSIRERLINGSLKGEKKSIGQREKWFVSATAVEAELRQQKTAQSTMDLLNSLREGEELNFSPDLSTAPSVDSIIMPSSPTPHSEINTKPIEESEIIDVSPMTSISGSATETERQRLESIVETLVRPLVDTVTRQEGQLREMGHLLAEKEAQLRLLPDREKLEKDRDDIQRALEKTEAEKRALHELTTLEIAALKKQISLLQEQQDHKDNLQLREKVEELSLLKNSLADLRLKVQSADLLHEKISELENKLLPHLKEEISEKDKSLEVQRKLAEDAARAKTEADERLAREVEERAKTEAELERIKEQTSAQTLSIQDQLTKLNVQLERSQRPWWKKLFGSESSGG